MTSEVAPVDHKVRLRAVPRKAPPSPDQQRRARWMSAMLKAATEDGGHPFWDAIDREWMNLLGMSDKHARIQHALRYVTDCLLVEYDLDAPFWGVDDLLDLLEQIDPAFDPGSPERARQIAKQYPRVNAWNLLARLAHAYGAFDCDCVDGTPKYEHVIKPTITKWKNSMPIRSRCKG